MRIIHWSNFAPHRSGLYECAKDQIKYERKLGLDSQMAVYEVENPPIDMVDGWLKPISWNASKDASLFVMHRGIPASLEKLKKPTICVIHGTVEYLITDEIFNDADKTPFNTHINLLKSYDACVAVNQHDFDIYKLYDPSNKLVLIHDAIDVERYTVEGYQHPFISHPQILFCDSLRINKHPAHVTWAMAEVIKKIPKAKLSVIGLELLGILTWRNLILRSPKTHLAKNLETVQLMTSEVRPYMRGADILFNSNMSGIPSRVELEGMACGCQVVGYSDSFTKWKANPYDIKDIAKKIIDCWNYIKENPKSRQEARNWVLKNANMEKQVKNKYIPLYKKVIREKK